MPAPKERPSRWLCVALIMPLTPRSAALPSSPLGPFCYTFGSVWLNCYHAYPAHAPFGGYKQSGFGRETHKMMLAHYRQTKNILTSYDQNKLGFF